MLPLSFEEPIEGQQEIPVMPGGMTYTPPSHMFEIEPSDLLSTFGVRIGSPQVVVTECQICVKLEGNLSYIGVQQAFCRPRNQDKEICQPPPPPDEPPPPPDEPPEDPPPPDEPPEPPPLKPPDCPDVNWSRWSVSVYYETVTESRTAKKGKPCSRGKTKWWDTNWTHTYTYEEYHGYSGLWYIDAWSFHPITTMGEMYGIDDSATFGGFSVEKEGNVGGRYVSCKPFGGDWWYDSDGNLTYETSYLYRNRTYWKVYITVNTADGSSKQYVGTVQDYFLEDFGESYFTETKTRNFIYEYNDWDTGESFTCKHPPPYEPYDIPPPPPPRDDDEDDDMSCCSKSQCRDIEDMLRKVVKSGGFDEYPAVVPKSLMGDDANKNVKVNSLSEMVLWFIQQYDALTGQYPIDIEIDDIDPSEEGNQKRKISLPNMAEAIGEIYSLVLKSGVDSDIHTRFLMRLAAESVANKNISAITQSYAKANALFLGYKATPKAYDMKYAFNANKLGRLEDILEDSEGEIEGWSNEDENTAIEYFQRLMFAASIIKSKFFKPAGVVSHVLNEVDRLAGGSEEDKAKAQELWENFLRNLSNGNHPKPDIKWD